MRRRSQIVSESVLHLLIISHHEAGSSGVWVLMVCRFSKRLVLLDDRADDFLKTLVLLGGYCTVEQAGGLGIARSPTRVLAHLRGLERAGFLRKLPGYPVVYQVARAATRLLETDRMARRPHPVETVRTRLLGVSFYLEALRWPARFVLDHAQKVAAFREAACPVSMLPQRSGKPYLWGEFILKRGDRRLAAVLVDSNHRSAFLQLWRLGRRFVPCLEQLGDGLQLLIAVGSEARYRLYSRLIGHPSLQKLSHGKFEVSIGLYRVRKPVRFLQSATRPDSGLPDKYRTRR